METVPVIALVVMCLLMAAGALMILFGLPGLFVVAGSYLAYGLITKEMNWWLFGMLAGAAVAGEALDWVVGIFGARKFGTTKKGVIGAVIGGILGAIIGVPVFLVGSILGMFLGAFLGAYLFEYISSKDSAAALKSAKGALLGRAAAIAVKFMLAVFCVVAILIKIF